MSGHRGAKDKRHRRNGNPRSQKLLQKVWKAKGMKGHRARAHKAKRDVRPQGRQEQPAQKGKRLVLTSEGHQTMFWGTVVLNFFLNASNASPRGPQATSPQGKRDVRAQGSQEQ